MGLSISYTLKDFNKNKVFVNKQEIKNDKTKKFYK